MKNLYLGNKMLESKESLLWWQEKGLSYTSTGYGSRIPTSTMVKVKNRWRRVYCCIRGNSGTCYIGNNINENTIIRDYPIL